MNDNVPFSELELIPKGYIDLLGGGKAPVYNTPVSPKTNYMLALNGEKPFWVPMLSDCKKFLPDILPDNLARGLLLCAKSIDLQGFTGDKDMFGIDWEYVPEVRGATVRPGSPFVTDPKEMLTKVSWPNPSVWDWNGCFKENEDYLSTNLVLNSTIFCGYFERLISFLDFEEAAIALIDEDNKPYVHAFFDRLTSLYEEIIIRFKKSFHLDLLEFHDDWGSQRSAIFSLDTVREMIVPYLKRLSDCAHKNGMIFELHSCGHHPEHVPAKIEAGVDCWAPQYNANNTIEIFEQYGDKITIGISCPLPLGSSDEQYIDWAKIIVDSCVGRKDKRTPFIHDMRTPAIFRETLYKLSREKLCGKE